MATATSPVDVNSIFSHLVGLGPWRRAAAALPSPDTYDDARIAATIPAMLRHFERDTLVLTSPHQVTTSADGVYPGSSDLPLLVEDGYDYYATDADNYMHIRLRQRPVQAVQRLRLSLGNQTIFTFPLNWVSLKKSSGDLHIIPTMGQLAVDSVGAASVALLSMGMAAGSLDYIPNGIQVDYTAGMAPLPTQKGPWWLDPYSDDGQGNLSPTSINPRHADLIRHLEMFCALEVLYDFAHLADAGLSSVSMSGGVGSESLNYTRFADLKQELEARKAEYISTYRDQEAPLLLGVLGG